VSQAVSESGNQGVIESIRQ